MMKGPYGLMLPWSAGSEFSLSRSPNIRKCKGDSVAPLHVSVGIQPCGRMHTRTIHQLASDHQAFLRRGTCYVRYTYSS